MSLRYINLLDKSVFQLGRSARQHFLLEKHALLSEEEKLIFCKIISLAKDKVNQPIHVVTAMAKASDSERLEWFCRYVMACKINYSVARFWNNSAKMKQADSALSDFKIVCDVLTTTLPLQHIIKRRQFKIMPSLNTVYKGKVLPFKFGSTLRNKVAKFKKGLNLSQKA